jgi:hypothetical protein
MDTVAVTRRHYFAIFMVAMVTIATQILISRIFSVTLYYHFAFSGITFAMLGITAGALRVYLRPEYFSALRAEAVLAEYSAKFGLSLTLAVVLHVSLPGQVAGSGSGLSVPHAVLLLGSLVALLYAFVSGGVSIALLLTRFPASTARLYAWDLGGAAFGCLAIIVVLLLLDPISVLFLLAAALAVMGWWLLPQASEPKLKWTVTGVASALVLLSVAQVGTYWHGDPIVRLTWAKGSVFKEVPEFERWNTYSRVHIVPHHLTEPFGWGFGHPQNAVSIDQKYLTIDAGAGTILTAFDGDLDKVRYLENDIVNLGYQIRDIDSVAVIGIGGGRDILSALVAGADRIQGIELNPAIVEALTDTFADFTGRLHKLPGVSMAAAEARTFLVSREESYDLIQISLIDTWAATAAGGLTLSESTLYTTDAWGDFVERLNHDGLLVVSRWYEPEIHRGEFHRMLAIAGETLRARDPGADPRAHLLAATVDSGQFSNGIVTVIMSKSPLLGEDVARFEEASRRLGFRPLLTPSYTTDDTAARLASGTADAAFFASLSHDLTPPTDDKPFFFYMWRLSDLFGGEDDVPAAGAFHANFQNNQAVSVLLTMFSVTLVATLFLIAWPLAKLYRMHQVRIAETFPYIAYFAGIGLGFMLIEISQMQRLMIFLGHPVYSLAVVLFTLLLASGVGSYMQRNVRAADAGVWLKPALLCMALVAVGLLTPLIAEQLKYYDTGVRIVASGLIIAGMGVFMGMMFPLGVALAAVRHEHLLPWYWGINGVASVFASVLAVVLSLEYGISFTFWVGVACYAVCLPAVLVARKHVVAGR